jgi:hypothetical protein
MKWIWITPLLVSAAAIAAPSDTSAKKKPAAKAPAAKPAPAKPMAFNPPELDLAPGETYLTELFVPSPTGKELQAAVEFSPARGARVQADSRFKDRIPPGA